MNQKKQILDKLRNAKMIICSVMSETRGRRKHLSVDFWNPDATNEAGMPDIVLAGDSFTIFYDELTDATIDGNIIKIGDKEFEINS